MVGDHAARDAGIRMRVGDRPREIARWPVVLAVDEVSEAPEGHGERKADREGVEVAQPQAAPPRVCPRGKRAEDDGSIDREAAAASIGFFSVVADRSDPERLLVRARRR
jgi:hypothetical protein